jgi:hypothetical protein
MTQISPPVRILLIGAVAFMAAWMMFLRPKAEEVPPAAAPAPAPATQPGDGAVSGPGKAVQEAANAKAQADARSQKAAEAGEQAAGSDTTRPAGEAAPAGKAKEAEGASDRVPATTGLPARVRAALGHGKVVALLFWNPRSVDDRAVRRALGRIDRHDGKVVAHATHVKRVATYQAITRGAQVDQSPTVVVIDRDRKVTTLVGYVDRRSIDQAVQDALRKS